MSENTDKQKYKSYTLENLLNDEQFIHFIKEPDPESEIFWNTLLEEGIIDRQNFTIASFYIQAVQVESVQIKEEEINEIWENIEIENKANLRNQRSSFYLFSGLAAGFLILLGLSFPFLLPENTPHSSFSIEDVPAPEISGNDIQLVLADNSTVTFEEKEIEVTHADEKIKINHQVLKNKPKQTINTESNPYNQLVVPLGKRSTISLEDGSRIWLNAGSRIVYPTRFDSHYREIFIEGEAFLDIMPEKRPFHVKSSAMQIEVLGTSFNLSAYKEDTEHSVVLVTGKVKVANKNAESVSLLPNQKYTVYDNNYKVEQVNTEEYTAWKLGYYQLKSENITSILKRLSRYYGETIAYISDEKTLCTGKLDLKDNLEEVLTGIGLTAPVSYQKIDDKYIVFNSKK